MSDKTDKNHQQELKEMIKDRKQNQPVEEILSVFCQRHGVSMGTCRVYYNQLVKSGEIGEK
jgi:predicted solute-binding protein